MFHVPHRFRIRSGPMASDDRFENNGAFKVPMGTRYISVIASDGSGWEHVSVSFADRCPTWDEMCTIKAMFWDAEDCVMQLHPPESEYVSHHPYCLHLWRPTDTTIPRPPMWTVGPRATGRRV
jgi:hypothetical protein